MGEDFNFKKERLMQVEENRTVTIKELAQLIDIIAELETYGGPARQTTAPRTAEKLLSLRNSLYEERNDSKDLA